MISVTRNRPCPICGKEDWCGYYPFSDPINGIYVMCNRYQGDNNVDGRDGRQYVYVGRSHSGMAKFEEYGQYLEHTRVYKEKRGYKNQIEKDNPMVFKTREEDFFTQKPKKENLILPQTPHQLHTIYQRMQQLLVLEDIHREYLYDQGWDETMIETYHIVSFPVEDRLRKMYHSYEGYKNITRAKLAEILIQEFGSDALFGVPGAYQESDGKWTFFGYSGILFPMYDMDGYIYRLRIRMDFRDTNASIRYDKKTNRHYVKETDGTRYFVSMKGKYTEDAKGNKHFLNKKGKYRTLSSFIEDKSKKEQGIHANLLLNGCGSGNELSMYLPPNADTRIWYITEGEPKGAFSAHALNAPVITIPGVNSFSLVLKPEVIDKMQQYGMMAVAVAFDADKKENVAVLGYEQKLLAGLKEAGVKMLFTVEWDGANGKGLDDNLAGGGKIGFKLY